MKKNLPLILILALCGIVFVGGLAVSVSTMLDNGKKEATIEKNKKKLDKLVKRKTLALSEENLEQGTASMAEPKRAKTAISVNVPAGPKYATTGRASAARQAAITS